jgi:hypothetical protein
VIAHAWARRLLDDARHQNVRLPPAPARDTISDCAVRDWAGSGAAWLTGRHDGPPLVPPGGAASAARGAGLAFVALSELLGAQVELAGHLLLGERAAFAGLGRRGPWNLTRTCRAVRAADGWLVLNLARPDDVAAVPALVETGIATSTAAQAWLAVQSWARVGPAADAAERAQLLGIPAGAIAAQPTAAQPDFPLRVPGYETFAPGAPPDRAPLVVDLSSLWAGPLCAHLLALAGARVVTVRAANRADGIRAGCPPLFRLLHSGHEMVVLDLVADQRRLRRLLDRADIVVTSARPRAIAQLGLDPAEVCGRSPTTWVSITAYGSRQDRVGFGDDVAMTAGLVMHDPRGTPLPCGDAIADPLTGLHAAVGALACYLHGGSARVDVAMHDVVSAATAIGPRHGAVPVRHGRDWWVPASTGQVRIIRPRARR